MSKLIISLFLSIITLTNGAKRIKPEQCDKFPCKIFEDNFDYLDTDMWEHEITMSGGGNNEFQIYVNNRSVSYVKDGNLYIKPQLLSNWKGMEFVESGDLDIWGMNGHNVICTSNAFDGCHRKGSKDEYLNPVMSARLRTLGSFSFKYGFLQVRAKVPRGQWLWPAVWLLPDASHYGHWPASGEIDILEVRGNDVYGGNGSDNLNNKVGSSTLHWGPYKELNRYALTEATYNSPDGGRFSDDYHTWTVMWTDQNIKYWLDEDTKPIFEVDPITNFWDYGNLSKEGDIDNPWVDGGKMAPFDREFYIIINLAVGGTTGFFPDIYSFPEKPWKNTQSARKAITSFWKNREMWLPSWLNEEKKISDEAALKIDYVRVWQTKKFP